MADVHRRQLERQAFQGCDHSAQALERERERASGMRWYDPRRKPPKVQALYLYSGMSDYWRGDGERWEASKACTFATYGPDCSLRTVINALVDDSNDGPDFQGKPLWDAIEAEDIRQALILSLSPEGLEEWERNDGSPCEFAREYGEPLLAPPTEADALPCAESGCSNVARYKMADGSFRCEECIQQDESPCVIFLLRIICAGCANPPNGSGYFCDDCLERERLECLFSLGGGELNDKGDPWGTARHWYEGPPEFANRDHQEAEYIYRTVLADVMFGFPDPPERGWEQVAIYHSSGERECWHCGHGTDWDGSEDQEAALEVCDVCDGHGTQNQESGEPCYRCKGTGRAANTNTMYRGNPDCRLCEGDGYIYLGDGWAELVYRARLIDCSRCESDSLMPVGTLRCGECDEPFCAECDITGPSAHGGYHQCPSEDDDG